MIANTSNKMIDKERYLRQIALPEVGVEGQRRLAEASVVIVGVGGLGSPISMLLTAAGVGRIGIVDFDTVSRSNLPRQLLYTEASLGKQKIEEAAARLRAMNSECTIESYSERLDERCAEQIISRYDMVVDGTDNLESRYLIDKICGKLSKPYIYGAIAGHVGQLSVFHHNGAGSYADLYPRCEAPERATPPAVIATAPSVIGAMEANEVIKLIVGYGESLTSRLLTIDLRSYNITIFDI